VTILELYAITSQSYSRPRDEEAGKAWERVLSAYSIEEIEGAIAAHRGDTTLDDQGRPRGRWMPMPADLKLLIEAGRRKAARRTQFISCGRCNEGWVAASGRPGERRVRRCPCHSEWAAQRRALVGVRQ
jgi:hypothetical protein